VTYLVDIIRVNTITSFLGSSLDPLLHDLLNVLLALFAVNVDVPLVPVAKFILKSLGTGTHAVLVNRYAFSTITIRIERKLVIPDCPQLLSNSSGDGRTWKAPRYRLRCSKRPFFPSYGNPHWVISG
jgi:hypothetical protein